MTDSERDLDAAVERFIERTEAVYDEYDEGYIDPDAALERLGDYVTDLRDAHETEQ